MFNFRTVGNHGNVYLRKEDVINFLRELGEDEPTDTRERLNEAADIIEREIRHNGVRI